MNRYLDIIIPVPLPRLFTYAAGEEWADKVAVGKRVVVSFGKKRLYSGVIASIHSNKPKDYDTKPILSVLDDIPVVYPNQIKFWNWIADYYQCTIGEVYKAALPSGLKLESESYVIYNENFVAEKPLPDKADTLLNIISERKRCTINELNNLSSMNNCLPVVKRLLELKAIFVNEKIKEGYKPKREKYLLLSDRVKSEHELEIALDSLKRAPKQQSFLLGFLSEAGDVDDALSGKLLPRTNLTKRLDASSSVIKELIKKNIFIQKEIAVDRIMNSGEETVDAKTLSPEQERAYNDITDSFNNHNVTLLHGVTSSGKTELYIHLITEYMKKGKQVLYLLPEIALTTQITTRLKKHFGDELGIFHSRFNDAERVEVWNNLINNSGYRVILGVRSSVFLPFKNLGLVIVDEEHETSYKQFDPAPRYHARDAAVVLAAMSGAKTLLGTGTPSFETYHNCENKKYGIVELFERYRGIKMPEILPVDTKEAYRKKQMKSHFHPILLEKMKEALDNDEQVILFQNRRGFSPYVECRQCAWVPRCEYCDVSLTYHKHLNQLVCHYCGHALFLPKTCPACGSHEVQTRGFGTEKIEEEIKQIFPAAVTGRMDLDTTRNKNSYEKIIGEFEQKKIQILIGTQMITKGLDFDSVSIVGILNADNMLNYPDFRAFERSYQMMAQVSGRAGRKGKQGLVILQTSDPQHPVIQNVVKNDFLNSYKTQLEERLLFRYPPFHRLINITIKHRDKMRCDKAARMLGAFMSRSLGDRVLGPQAPPINRIQNLFLNKLLVKIEKDASIKRVKAIIAQGIDWVKTDSELKSAIFQIDVDPM